MMRALIFLFKYNNHVYFKKGSLLTGKEMSTVDVWISTLSTFKTLLISVTSGAVHYEEKCVQILIHF